MPSPLRRLADALPRLLTLDRRLDEIKINQGILLSELRAARPAEALHDHEFKIFSQWGEDGILQFLTRNLDIEHRTFIEFGVEDFFESNCRLLLMKDGWQGFVIDGSPANMERLRSSYFYWRYPITAVEAFVTRENVDELLGRSGFDRACGILSIDVDGVDWHLLEALGEWRAAIVVVEYNSLYGARHPVSVPYRPDFMRATAHWSNLYWGASLPAFDSLLTTRGYSLVGVNSVGSNAFFVRRDLLNERVRATTVEACFRESSFRETRDAAGRLVFRTARQARQWIADLPLIDTATQRALKVSDVFDDECAS